MNTKIFKLIKENLEATFNLPKYKTIAIDADTVVDQLPWTPARYRKFKDHVEAELALEDCGFNGTLESVVDTISERYIKRFFGEIWKPRTDDYSHTGWQLVEEVNKLDPKNVLDVGCGYHPFKGRIQNLTGIDPYNAAADYQVDILEYRVKHKHDVIIALGSINFNSRQDIEDRFAHCVNLLMPAGRMYFRVNPGIPHAHGPWVDIFPWTFEIVNELCEKYNLTLDTFKRDFNQRIFFICSK